MQVNHVKTLHNKAIRLKMKKILHSLQHWLRHRRHFGLFVDISRESQMVKIECFASRKME